MPTMRVVIHIQEEEIESRTLTRVLRGVDAYFHGLERQNVSELANEFGIPPVIRDATLERIRKFRGRHIRIERVEAGTLTVTVAIVAISVWLLNRTVGESVKEGWKRTDAHTAMSKMVKLL